jgi:hypothetical protein
MGNKKKIVIVMLRGWIIPSAHNLLQLLSAHRNNVRFPRERERANILGEGIGEGIVRLGHQQLQQQSILLLVGWKSYELFIKFFVGWKSYELSIKHL